MCNAIIVESMKKELAINGTQVVSGDTKVVPKGSVYKIFINTTGIGEVQKNGINSNATIIGNVSSKHLKKVILNSAWGTQRFLDMPSGELLPRIC